MVLAAHDLDKDEVLGWCHLSTIPGTSPHCLVNTKTT